MNENYAWIGGEPAKTRRPFEVELEAFQLARDLVLLPREVVEDAGIRSSSGGGWVVTFPPLKKELAEARAKLAAAEARIAELESELEHRLKLAEAPLCVLTLRADTVDLWYPNTRPLYSRSELLAEPYPGLSQIPGARNDWAPEEPSTYAPDHGEDLEIDTAEERAWRRRRGEP